MASIVYCVEFISVVVDVTLMIVRDIAGPGMASIGICFGYER
jgi:hypothetical protein